MFDIQQLKRFESWLNGVRDVQARAEILTRLDEAGLGNFGDHKLLAGGVYELRIHIGQGYRLYLCHLAGTIYILMMGGTKKGQKDDINEARRLAKKLRSAKRGKAD